MDQQSSKLNVLVTYDYCRIVLTTRSPGVAEAMRSWSRTCRGWGPSRACCWGTSSGCLWRWTAPAHPAAPSSLTAARLTRPPATTRPVSHSSASSSWVPVKPASTRYEDSIYLTVIVMMFLSVTFYRSWIFSKQQCIHKNIGTITCFTVSVQNIAIQI